MEKFTFSLLLEPIAMDCLMSQASGNSAGDRWGSGHNLSEVSVEIISFYLTEVVKKSLYLVTNWMGDNHLQNCTSASLGNIAQKKQRQGKGITVHGGSPLDRLFF